MAWVKVHEEVVTHHKTARLASGLGCGLAQAAGHLLLLWLFAVRNAWKDGDLTLWGDDGIERAAGWEGEKGTLIKVLREVGWMDGSAIHDWMDIAGAFVYQRQANEAAVKAKQAKKASLIIATPIKNGLKTDSDKIRVDEKRKDVAAEAAVGSVQTDEIGPMAHHIAPPPEPAAALVVKPVEVKPLVAAVEKPRTPIQKVMRAYKVAKGIEPDDAGWDKHNYAQYVRAAVKLLEAFDMNVEASMVFMLTKGEEWDEQNLPDWTLHAIAKHAWDHRGKTIAAKITGGPDVKSDEGRRAAGEGLGGGAQEQVVDNRVLGPGRARRITPAGEVAGEVIDAIMPESDGSGPRLS